MQSEGSRMAEWLLNDESPAGEMPYEVRMATFEMQSAVHQWTEVRRKAKPMAKTFSFTVDTDKIKEKFDKGVEIARDKMEDISIKAQDKVSNMIVEDTEEDQFFSVTIVYGSTSGGTRTEFTGTESQVLYKIKQAMKRRESLRTGVLSIQIAEYQEPMT